MKDFSRINNQKLKKFQLRQELTQKRTKEWVMNVRKMIQISKIQRKIHGYRRFSKNKNSVIKTKALWLCLSESNFRPMKQSKTRVSFYFPTKPRILLLIKTQKCLTFISVFLQGWKIWKIRKNRFLKLTNCFLIRAKMKKTQVGCTKCWEILIKKSFKTDKSWKNQCLKMIANTSNFLAEIVSHLLLFKNKVKIRTKFLPL